MSENEQAMLRSQSGPLAGAALLATPSNDATRIESHLFRVLLLRRLRLPLPPVSRTCRCGRPLDSFGHHRAACSRAGVLGRRGFAVESIGARICREGGARVATNVHVRDLDILAPEVQDGRRIEIIAEGLPLFGGAQLAVDMSPRAWAARVDGVALRTARRRKEQAERSWWCWQERLEDVGQLRLRLSFASSPQHTPVLRLRCCARGQNRLGGFGGPRCSHALLRERLLHLCWNRGQMVVVTD